MGKPKFKVGDKVINKRFGELQRVTHRRKGKGGWYYRVRTLTGPGPYGGTEMWAQDELKRGSDESKS